MYRMSFIQRCVITVVIFISVLLSGYNSRAVCFAILLRMNAGSLSIQYHLATSEQGNYPNLLDLNLYQTIL